MSNQEKYIISGSGISGLITALLLCEKGLGNQTIVVEKNEAPGGLLRKYEYGEFGVFDYGMHNFLETGISELDKLIFNLLPEEEWQLLEGEKRDLAGIYYNNTVQMNSPFFDLRTLEKTEFQEALSNLLEHLTSQIGKPKIDTNCTAEEFGVQRFGKYVASKTVIPSVEKIHRKKASELDYMAAIFTPMSRVVIADTPLINELTESNVLKDYLAWSDQRTLPLKRSSGRRAYYPKKYGAYRIVDAIVERLQKSGVQILLGYEISGIEYSDKAITKISVKGKEQIVEYTDPKLFVWTSNIPLLGRMLKTDFTGLKNDKPLKTVIINILLDKPLNMGDMYYFFCYQAGFYTYRLTNYVNYSSGAVRNGLYPICIEFLLTEEELNSDLDINKRAIEELEKFKILSDNTNIKFIKHEVLENGFPMPSVNNIHAVKTIRNDIKSKNLNNLLLAGILSEDNMFFQTDVLIDVFNKLKNI